MPDSRSFPWHQAAWQRFNQQLALNHTPHATLISGPAGVGKQRFAESMAARLLCEAPLPDAAHACGECRGCRLRLAGSHPDLKVIQPEEDGSGIIKIDEVRQLTEFTQLSSQYGGLRVGLLMPAEAMNRQTANALLKTLEEPPAQVVLILVSHSIEQLPATIRSRCQILPIHCPSTVEATEWLKTQGVSEPAAALHLAAGAPLQALSIANGEGDAKYLELGAAISGLVQGNGSAVGIAEEWREWGALKTAQLMQRLVSDLRRAQISTPPDGLPAEALQNMAKRLSATQLHTLMDRLTELRMAAKQPLSKELSIEACFLLWTESSHAD